MIASAICSANGSGLQGLGGSTLPPGRTEAAGWVPARRPVPKNRARPTTSHLSVPLGNGPTKSLGPSRAESGAGHSTGAGHDLVQDPIETRRLAPMAEIAASNRATPVSSAPRTEQVPGLELQANEKALNEETTLSGPETDRSHIVECYNTAAGSQWVPFQGVGFLAGHDLLGVGRDASWAGFRCSASIHTPTPPVGRGKRGRRCVWPKRHHPQREPSGHGSRREPSGGGTLDLEARGTRNQMQSDWPIGVLEPQDHLWGPIILDTRGLKPCGASNRGRRANPMRTHMHHLTAATVAALIAWSEPALAQPPSEYEATDFMPLAVGNSWTFKHDWDDSYQRFGPRSQWPAYSAARREAGGWAPSVTIAVERTEEIEGETYYVLSGMPAEVAAGAYALHSRQEAAVGRDAAGGAYRQGNKPCTVSTGRTRTGMPFRRRRATISSR